jgi:mannose/fructose/N-acetylgalactosamine-specific phosphotransferase system component IIB
MVNIGGVRSPEATIKLTKEVSATPDEMEAWRELDRLGIRMEVQFLPNQGATILNDVLKKFE